MKAVRLCVVAVLATLVAVLGVDSAAAAPSSTAPYPPSTCASLAISTTTPYPGQTITLTGTNFAANEKISLKLDTGALLGTVTTSASGSFSTKVTIPNDASGNHTITVVSRDDVCPIEPIQIQAQGIDAASNSNGGGSGLASTGVNVLIGLLVAAALITGGVLLSRSGRRRPHHSRH